MTALMPRLAARGAEVPAAIMPQAYRFLEAIEAIVTAADLRRGEL